MHPSLSGKSHMKEHRKFKNFPKQIFTLWNLIFVLFSLTLIGKVKELCRWYSNVMLMKVSESNLHAVFSSLQVISLPLTLSRIFSPSLSSSSSCLSFVRASERHLSPHPAVNFDTCLMHASLFSHRTYVHMDGLSITPHPLLLQSSLSHKWLAFI